MKTTADIRRDFLHFFESKGHQIVASSSLVPENDPTLLFTNAGMNQFKEVFLGQDQRNYKRATTAQRCVRAGGKHNDLENVGYTARHHTFFEMLGNFSFGDYFKQDAIQFAWEFLTSAQWLNLPKEKLWVTVYETDQEAYDIWNKTVGVPAERIVRIGDNKGSAYASDNFWQMGDTGPCGPCTEIFYDHGEHIWGGPPGSAEEDGDRYIEIWNVVFMQFNRQADGTMLPLPKPSVDTGMGLERITAVLQHVNSNYNIDIFRRLVGKAAEITGTSDLKNKSLNVIADHIRSCAYLIADGVMPSNEGRGYVLRRIIRRAVRHGHLLGAKGAFFYQLVPTLIEVMAEAGNELETNQALIEKLLRQEEEQFARTLERGLVLLDEALAKVENNLLSGEVVFKLYDTYGFPYDLTADICREKNITIDQAGFDRAMEAQRQQAQAASNFGVTGNLVFGGNWDIDVGDSLRVHAQLARTSGDVQVQTGDIPNPTVITSSGASTGPTAVIGGPRPVVPVPLGPTTSAGVRQAQLTLDATDKTVRTQLIWDSANAGQAQADASTQLTPNGGGWQWAPDAPLSGKVQANLPSIGAWSVLAPPGWRVQGTLNANAQLSGTRNAPRWAGTLAADNLAIRSVVDGVDLQNGRLRASLNGQRIDITDFTLRGGTGSSTRISGFSGNRTSDAPGEGGVLSGRGFATWAAADTGAGAGAATGSGIRMEFDAEAKALRAMVRSDRQVTLSGTMQARLNDGQFTLRANLKTDRAAIILPDETAPQLGKDVVVRSASHTKPAPAPAAAPTDQPVARVQTPKPPDVAITFNLGNDFAVQGHGVTTRLTGELDIRSTQGLGSPPRVTGEIRTDNGKYRAYGQQLDIETGVVRFNGTLENPSLDVLALRPNISVRAGVQITGTAQSPRVRLYSDPVMPDAEKLSWVVLGHSTANGGAEAALLQQAALSLLGRRGVGPGSVANRLGLDEVGFRAPADGESASGAVLTFGKRFSQRMYVTYESTLTSALGTLFIFYDLTRNLTLRAQTGARSAVDLIYTVNFD